MGCSIEISRDIYIICMSVCRFVYDSVGNPCKKTYVKMRERNYVIQTRACSKSDLGV